MTDLVYVIGSANTRPVRIGHSINVTKRLADLQRMCPVPLAVLDQFEGGAGLESALHDHFGAFRVHGEWFDFGTADPVKSVRSALPHLVPKPAGTTPLRNIRATDEVWKPALARARAEGTDLTKVLVAFLKEYGAGWDTEDDMGAEDLDSASAD